MSAKGKFDIPSSADQSTEGARRAYNEEFGWDWPHDDAYLRQLAAEVPSTNDLMKDGVSGGRCDFLIMLMRENDDDKEGGR